MKHIIPFRGNFPLSHAIIHDYQYTMELSGFIGMNPETNELESGIENQTKRILDTIKETLEHIGWSMSDLIKVRIFMNDMSEYAKMNAIYADYFD
jgi:2-iminobutanoate/2-iminopropanoate deaminase